MWQAVTHVCYCDITFLRNGHFYSNSATNLHYLTSHAVLPHNTEIVMRPQITVTSLHPMYSLVHSLTHASTQADTTPFMREANYNQSDLQ